MVLDSSALVSIALLEPSWRSLAERLGAGPVIIGSPTLLESHIVLRSRLAEAADAAIQLVLISFQVAIVPFDDDHRMIAAGAFDRYGKGRHRASLNFGDCMSYAVAKRSDQPLVYVGTDFDETDIRRE
jgi:ribonuclease VapC